MKIIYNFFRDVSRKETAKALVFIYPSIMLSWLEIFIFGPSECATRYVIWVLLSYLENLKNDGLSFLTMHDNGFVKKSVLLIKHVIAF